MRCIFCKKESSSSKSVEHIIPESLGNKEHVLPCGVVCDSCNNYFSRMVEKPFLDSLYFRYQRFSKAIPSKKGRIPNISGIHLQSLTKVDLCRGHDKSFCIESGEDTDEPRWIHSLLKHDKGTLIMPVAFPPKANDYIVSRFVAKVGLAVLAQRGLKIPGALDEIIDKTELDGLRSYVRIGSPGKIWPYSQRSIYSPDILFSDGMQPFEVLHEYDILITDSFEYYIALAIFGIEYVLNLGGRELDGYRKWLKKNNGKSPLYIGKNA